MSNALKTLPPQFQVIEEQEKRFNELNIVQNVSFEQEKSFAVQAMANNDFLMKVATSNIPSLKAAMLNVASIGLSLNPAKKHAYLVPRDNKVCLDISYLGLVKLATDCGAIQWAKAELVYEADKFELRGMTEEPVHHRDPFKTDRGEVVGAYCVAKLNNGDLMTTAMSKDEIEKIRNTSKNNNGKFSPWVTFWDEMAKKTVIKRAAKSWPQTENRERWDNAIQVLNEHEGMGFTLQQYKDFMTLLDAVDDNEANACEFFMYTRTLDEQTYTALYNSGEKGQKVKLKNRISNAERLGSNQLNEMTTNLYGIHEAQDESAVMEIKGEYPDYIEIIASMLNPNDADYFLKTGE